jgi:hypothetical protein
MIEAVPIQECSTCRHAKDYGNDDFVLCRRNPPCLCGGHSHNQKTFFAIVRKTCCCGEYRN